jgi:mRNA-degrading endonuclease toxin of MazEF toxin-antitoxin module
MPYVPDRGDIIRLPNAPAGPCAFVISERDFTAATGWVVICPITPVQKSSPFEAALPAGLQTTGCVLAAAPRTIENTRRPVTFVEKAPWEVTQKVQMIICATVGCT